MNRTKLFLAVSACALLQVSVLDSVRIFGVKPDLLVICVVIASLRCERGFALLAALLCGILKDTFSVTAFGLHTFLFPVLSMAVIFAARKIALDTIGLASCAAFALVIVYDAASRLAYALLGQGISVAAYLRISFLQALYTAAAVPLMFKLFKKLV